MGDLMDDPKYIVDIEIKIPENDDTDSMSVYCKGYYAKVLGALASVMYNFGKDHGLTTDDLLQVAGDAFRSWDNEGVNA